MTNNFQFKIFNFQTRSKPAGFTIIESLVAIAVLVTAITGAMSAVQTGIASYTFSKDQITAFYLAQEAVEQIRNIRDENRLKNRNWLYGITQSSSDPCYFGKACMVEPIVTDTATTCSGGVGNCPVLRQSPTSGLYGYSSSWTPTKFTRQITLTSINADEIVVTVKVNWGKSGINREFEAQENLLNWQ